MGRQTLERGIPRGTVRNQWILQYGSSLEGYQPGGDGTALFEEEHHDQYRPAIVYRQFLQVS